jgi:hypothetical protein
MTNVVIIGVGKGDRALLEMLIGDPTVTILGIADLNQGRSWPTRDGPHHWRHGQPEV